MTTSITPTRLALALFTAALAGAAAPEATLLITAHTALLLGGVKIVRALEPEPAKAQL